MEFKTVGDLRKYFEDVQKRMDAGRYDPRSRQGEEDRDRLLYAITELQSMMETEKNNVLSGELDAITPLVELADLRAKLAILLGKFEGFRQGVIFVVAKAGVYSQYLN